ncbi:carbon-nitrogen hydrolase family protein [Burkholderia cenocepacia]|uniref:carbon-nitrogen hydrolase family protein n=1 Tax=Burkholderia cenocepacia TaxID=95486 RepID=UPI00196A4C6B|nr:carbon-nitrogen hydrolase family protein [Burkholderia cenocepacia]MBN3503034.1 carbon-nitrogen hydrolase family protein [Burkholderia cenocepacia]MCO1394461.1 carbon-nitrogen hydrolase family protein [Burkholderia cenocepacia]MCO1404723.1 carbon-nitrogen hydrolase family protein [Burkholderia cenocepacia]MCO8325487.1 carbon-nitrogen hydrolase family protein [Burkholderia cenocepacia]MCO8332557.1 carbon-nitrogen hydrolase family protein [Burkholderia cenocepacia]
MSLLRLRLIQSTLKDDAPASNLAQALAHIAAARGQADLVVFSETYLPGFPTPDNVAQLAEPLDGPSVSAIRAAARDARVAVVIGFAEQDGGRYFNTAILVDEFGELRLRYRKSHLYESDAGVFEAGGAFDVCEWRGIKVGMLICFDLEFPETARALARAGAELIVIPDGMMQPHGHVHRKMIPVRALENQVFVAMANRVGPGDRYTFSGASLVASPDGDVMAEAPSDQDAVLDVGIDMDAVSRNRAAFRYLDLVHPGL